MTSAFEDLKWALLKDYLASTRRGSGSQSTDRSAVNVGLHVDKNAGETSSLIIIDPAASSERHPQNSHLLSNPQIRASCESCFLCKLLIGKKDEPPRNRTENPQIKSSTGRCPLDAAPFISLRKSEDLLSARCRLIRRDPAVWLSDWLSSNTRARSGDTGLNPEEERDFCIPGAA